jgi:hypothetical protein
MASPTKRKSPWIDAGVTLFTITPNNPLEGFKLPTSGTLGGCE